VERVIDVQHLIYWQGQHVRDALFLHVQCTSNLELSFHLTSLALMAFLQFVHTMVVLLTFFVLIVILVFPSMQCGVFTPGF
jgi:flagellar biosynthesis protein FliP